VLADVEELDVTAPLCGVEGYEEEEEEEEQ
jgi:hypothetical protein